MQKQTIFFHILLSALLLSSMNCISAQESVSNYEQSLINKTEPVTQIRPENSLSGISAKFDMEALTNELKARGWRIEHKTDGSLILIPHQSSDIVSGNQSDKNTSINEQWQQLQQKFQNAGWTAELDADGAMLLTPPHIASTTRPEEINPAIKSNDDRSFRDMQQKLKASGWHISNHSDGSVILYPPELYPEKKTIAKKLLPCPGIKPIVAVLLPVDSWQEAHDIARGWLKNESLADSTVGKIRKIFNVYIISIVSDKAPFTLLHQIAIKNTNGSVIVLN